MCSLTALAVQTWLDSPSHRAQFGAWVPGGLFQLSTAMNEKYMFIKMWRGLSWYLRWFTMHGSKMKGLPWMFSSAMWDCRRGWFTFVRVLADSLRRTRLLMDAKGFTVGYTEHGWWFQFIRQQPGWKRPVLLVLHAFLAWWLRSNLYFLGSEGATVDVGRS